jgi:hypothetical protein
VALLGGGRAWREPTAAARCATGCASLLEQLEFCSTDSFSLLCAAGSLQMQMQANCSRQSETDSSGCCIQHCIWKMKNGSPL